MQTFNGLGEIYEELLRIWNRKMLDEKIVKELKQSELSYLKEDLAQNLLSLTTLIETAKAENVSISQETRSQLGKTLLLIQRVTPALQGLETATLGLIKEAVDAVADSKTKLKFTTRKIPK